MKLYRFSPIKTKEELLQAIAHVAKQSNKLCEKITGQRLPITYLTIFAHYRDEYEQLLKIASNLGEISDANNGIAVKLKVPIETAGQTVIKLRIRKPDPYRTQVGCNDFDPGDYQAFKEKYLAANPNNLRVIQRPEYEMIEFYDPDFDVFSYVVGDKQ